jgi:uncharacterized protein YqeY
MSLRERVEVDMKQAMRDQNAIARDTLRMTLSSLKNRRIELGRDLEEAEEQAVISKAVKSRQESAEQFTSAGRAELAEKERAEMAVLEGYLPEGLSEDETRGIVKGIIEELGLSSKQDIGAVMKTVMARHRGSVDGKAVQQIAGEILS